MPTSADIDSAFAVLLGHDRIALAVSGGSDSIALMHLGQDWTGRRAAAGLAAPDLIVLTVDHGLRVGATADAAFVLGEATALGLPAEVLTIQQPAPTTGIQAWAREARYGALIAAARRHGCTAVATGHTRDDQAETVLMRLARGSGVDGLAAMAKVSHRDGVAILRPLLGMARADLRGWLMAHGHPWREDPSNADPRFERVRLRQTGRQILGDQALARVAARAARARDALEWATDVAMAELWRYADLGAATFSANEIMTLPADIRTRLLARAIAAVGGAGDRAASPSLARLERLADHIAPDAEPWAATLGGCRLEWSTDTLAITRLPARGSLPTTAWNGTGTCSWDHRFMVTRHPPTDPEPLSVGPITRAHFRRAVRARLASIPGPMIDGLPAIWRGDEPIVPWFGSREPEPPQDARGFTAQAIPPRGWAIEGGRLIKSPPA